MRSVLILVVLALGCGEPTAAPAAPGDEGSGGPLDILRVSGGTGGATGAGGAGGASGAGGEAAGACDNVSDLEVLAGAGSVRDVARDCGVNRCNGPSSPNADVYEGCVNSCVENDVGGLSSECAGCYSAMERCSLDSFCQLRCQLNTCSPMCLSCLRIAGCTEDFEACRAIEGTECPE